MWARTWSLAHERVYKMYTAQGTAGAYTRGWAVCCSISFQNPCLHVYLHAKSLCCSSIKAAAHVELLPQSLTTRKQQLSIISPCYEEGCFAVAGCCSARDGLTPVKTHVFPHFPAAVSDPVYLLSASCSPAQGWEAVSARVWERGALICRCVRRKGQDLKQNRLAGKQSVGSCWSNYALWWRIFFIFWSRVQENRELFFDEFMPQCLGKLGSLCFAVHLYLPQTLRKTFSSTSQPGFPGLS